MVGNNLTIVYYTGGCCGDLIVSLIDPTNAAIDDKLKTMQNNSDRSKLKKHHLFESTTQKLEYLETISKQYASIPSHDLAFHLENMHDFISIIVEDFDVAMWAAQRFKNCHRPHVWDEMKKMSGAVTVEDYATALINHSIMISNHSNRLLKLEDIVTGKVIPKLSNLLDIKISDESIKLYHNWMALQH
jgi:hypothetical protein